MVRLVFCVGFWTLAVTYLGWRLLVISQRAIAHLKKLHQIPCSKCTYFTGDYRLKCTVNPVEAMSETAIGCRDFQAQGDMVTANNCVNAGSVKTWSKTLSHLSAN